MAERKCLMTFYPTDCKDDCFNCKCGGTEATKDMYVSINNVQRVCSITGGAADTDEGEYIAEVIRNNLENMVIPTADVQPVDRWISVKDKLPEENILVLCYARSTTGEGNNYFLGALAHGEFWFLKVNDIGHVSCPVLHWEVTHWQPLPESPKED